VKALSSSPSTAKKEKVKKKEMKNPVWHNPKPKQQVDSLLVHILKLNKNTNKTKYQNKMIKQQNEIGQDIKRPKE
jgi:hypothetical protein